MLTSLVVPIDGANVGVVPNYNQVRLASLESDGLLPLFVLLEEYVQLHWSQIDLFLA